MDETDGCKALARHIKAWIPRRPSPREVIRLILHSSQIIMPTFEISHLAISVSSLTFAHTPLAPPSLQNIDIHLPHGSRTIICGANGGVLPLT